MTSAANSGDSLTYRIIDCDNHYYEPDDCFTRHIENRFREQTVWVDRARGRDLGTMMLGSERLSFFSVAVADFVGEPGSMEAFFTGVDGGQNQVNANPIRVQDHPEFTERNSRLAKMAEQSIETCVMIPTLGVGVEYQLRNHPQLLYPSLRAYNLWLQEDWGLGQDKQIITTPIVSLFDIDQAIAELRSLLSAGAKAIHVTAGPVCGRSPADKYYDPFWALVEESGTKVVFHIGETGCNQLYAAPWGEPPTPPSHRFSAFNTYVGIGERSITDTLASLFFLNLFGRFKQLEVLVVEFGASWVPRFVNTLDKIYRMADHKTRWRYEKPPTVPSELFARHVRIVPFYEDNISELIAAVGSDCLINGSDYPHPEGLGKPTDMVGYMDIDDSATVKKIMRDNACKLFQIAV